MSIFSFAPHRRDSECGRYRHRCADRHWLLPIAQFPNIAAPEIWLQAELPWWPTQRPRAVCGYADQTASHRRRQMEYMYP